MLQKLKDNLLFFAMGLILVIGLLLAIQPQAHAAINNPGSLQPQNPYALAAPER